jgi:tetratricopeptide (TPR) repeat protein
LTRELARRSAGFQPAGSPISNRQDGENSNARCDSQGSQAGSPAIQQIGNLRYKELIYQLRGDLDWIVMKCLEKDRARRYETANGLATDIQRHLSNEPVVACPPSKLYRFQKLVRRNKLTFAAVGGIAAALVIGLAVALWQSVEKTRAYHRALAADKAAQTEAAKSQQVAKFLKDMLKGVGPSVALGRDTTMLREILDKTAERVGKDLKEQPEVQAEMWHTLGNTYRELGDYLKAEEMGREALALNKKLFGNEHPEVASWLNWLGGALFMQGRRAEAEPMLREALAMQRKLLGNEHLYVADSLNTLALLLWQGQHKRAEAELMFREALAMCRKLLGNEDPYMAYPLFNLGQLLRGQGRLTEAEAMSREALALNRKFFGNERRAVAGSVWGLAHILCRQKKFDEIEKLFADILPPTVENQPQSVRLLRVRAYFRARRGRFAEAAADFTKAVELDPKDPKDHESCYYLAAALVQTGSLEAYQEHCRRSAERFADTTKPHYAEHIAKACLILPASGADPETVAKLADTSASGSEEDAARFQFPKGLAEYRQGRFASAVEWMQKVLSKNAEHPNSDTKAHRDVQAGMVLAMARYQLRQIDEARSALATGLEIAEAKLPSSTVATWSTGRIGLSPTPSCAKPRR